MGRDPDSPVCSDEKRETSLDVGQGQPGPEAQSADAAAPPSPGPSLPPSPHPSCSLHPPRGLQGLEMFGQLPVLWLSSCDLASLLAAGNLGMDQAM